MKFTLKQLMALVTAVAVGCAALFALPPWLTAIVVTAVILLIPTVFIAGIVYGRGYSRAFSIGALWGGGIAPLVHIYLAYIAVITTLEADWSEIFISDSEVAWYMRIVLLIVVGLEAASGLISMSLYWLLRGRHQRSTSATTRTTSAIPEYTLFHGRFESVQFDTGISKTRV